MSTPISGYNYQISIEFFVPSWDAFILSSSKLASTTDLLGPPLYNVGKWVTVTCDAYDIKTIQSYSQFHPLSMYDTGVAEITMKGIHWSPSVNPDIMPGIKVRISAVQKPIDGEFSNQFNTQYLSTGIPRTQFMIFYGYVLDVDEDWGGNPDFPDSMVLTAVDEWHKVVKLEGELPIATYAFNLVPKKLREWGVNCPDTAGLIPTYIGLRNSQLQLTRAIHSVTGTAWVKDDKVILEDNTAWNDKVSTCKISDRHIGPHLCYTDFDKRQRLTNVMNNIEQTNIQEGADGEETKVTTIFTDAASVAFYGKSGHSAETALLTNSWPGNSYITSGRYPEVRTRSVDVQLRPDNIYMLPHIQDSVDFTYRGKTEKRRVAGRTLHFTPTKWEGTINFFDFVLFEVSSSPLSGPLSVSGKQIIKQRELMKV